MFSCVSHFILWHNVCNKLGSFLFVHKMFCNVSYFRFSQYKENSYFTFIFLFSRTGFALTDKIAASYILLEKGRRSFPNMSGQPSTIFYLYKCIFSKNYGCLCSSIWKKLNYAALLHFIKMVQNTKHG